MKLMVPTMELARQIMAFRQDFLDHDGTGSGMGSLMREETAEGWIRRIEMFSREETCPQGLVPATQMVFWRETDKKIVGCIQIRHRFNPYIEKFAGHIGYSVCPSERRKGYAVQMLQEALPYCREVLGLGKVLVCCVEDNEASRRTILRCGGKYESTVLEPERNIRLERYWISLE